MKLQNRLILWLSCLILSIALFTMLLGGKDTSLAMMKIAFKFASPIWCLYLPLIIAFRSVEGKRAWILLCTGIFVGPASLAALGLVQIMRGFDAARIWMGSANEDLGLLLLMFFASVIGTLTVAFYVLALKILGMQSPSVK